MKAVVLAAGKGTRMLPLTKDLAKVLVEVNGKPFLFYVLKHLEEAGFDEIAIIVGYKKEQFPAFLEKYGFRAKLIEQIEQKGTGDAVKLAKKFAGDDNFIALGGDNLWSSDDMKSVFVDDSLCYVAGIKVDSPEKYGVIVSDKGKLLRIVEKPKEFVGNMINTGLYKFTPEIFDALDRIKLSPRGEYELTDAITLLARKSKANVYEVADYWLDLGTVDDIPRVEKFLKSIKQK